MGEVRPSVQAGWSGWTGDYRQGKVLKKVVRFRDGDESQEAQLEMFRSSLGVIMMNRISNECIRGTAKAKTKREKMVCTSAFAQGILGMLGKGFVTQQHQPPGVLPCWCFVISSC